MNILELAILKKMVGGGGGSGTDNYNDLSNLPQINGETLAGNKTAENLGLQDALTFDSAPTEDSTNPVESGGVYNALAGKQDNLTFDDDPTENSTNPVKSGGVYSALAGKQDNLTFDGVYNASTNKAATESTVTNAIAGLDVSDFSVDADETISSISETDGKINVTKQDIAIASNQVTAMTGYTKPSSAPATPAIQTSDTANQAFGKLEFKADTNQTNILSVQDATKELVDKGTKNIFDVQTPDAMRDTSIAPLANGGITISCTNAIWTNYKKSVSVVSNKPYRFMIYVDSISEGLQNFDVVVYSNETTPVLLGKIENIHSTSAYHLNLTPTTDSITVWLYLNDTATAKTQSANIRVLLCSMAEWNASPTYEPFALPNYDLTRLEAEDRAALVECVDKGAKNLFNYDTVTIASSGFVIPNTTPMILAEGSYEISYTANQSESGNVEIGFLDANSDLIVSHTLVSQSGRNKVVLTIPIGKTSAYIYMFSANGGTFSDFMVCTELEAKISPSYQPYALPNYELTKLEAEDRASLAEVVDSGAKQLVDLSNTGTGTHNTVTFTNLGGNKYKINGTPSADDTHLDIMGTWSSVPSFISENVGKTIVFATNQEHVYYGIIPIVGGSALEYVSGNKTNPIAYTIPSNLSGALLRIYVDTNQTYNNVTAELLVCTKAAYDVSQKFVPYQFPAIRKNYLAWTSITTSTAIAFTGVAFVPTKSGIYRITATANYSSAKPTLLELRKSDGSTERLVVTITSDSDSNGLTTSVLVGISAGYTLKVYAQYASESTENIGLLAEFLE